MFLQFGIHGFAQSPSVWVNKHECSLDAYGSPKTRRLINEIVLEEESDINIQGEPASHYEMYLDAMEQCGADTAQVKRLIARLLAGYSHKELIAFNVEQLEDYTLEFVKSTLRLFTKESFMKLLQLLLLEERI